MAGYHCQYYLTHFFFFFFGGYRSREFRAKMFFFFFFLGGGGGVIEDTLETGLPTLPHLAGVSSIYNHTPALPLVMSVLTHYDTLMIPASPYWSYNLRLIILVTMIVNSVIL